MQVSLRAVQHATVVEKKGTLELKKAVDDGKLKASVAAKLAMAPAETQKAAAEGGKAVAREIVKKIEAKKEKESEAIAAVAQVMGLAPVPPIKTLGLEVPPEILARVGKEIAVINKLSRLLAELKRTYTEYEGLQGSAGKLGPGKHYQTALRNALDALSTIRGQRPASICPSCKLLPELMEDCASCRRSGYIGETALGRVEACLLAEGDSAGVWVNGQWRTMASMTGDDF